MRMSTLLEAVGEEYIIKSWYFKNEKLEPTINI